MKNKIKKCLIVLVTLALAIGVGAYIIEHLDNTEVEEEVESTIVENSKQDEEDTKNIDYTDFTIVSTSNDEETIQKLSNEIEEKNEAETFEEINQEYFNIDIDLNSGTVTADGAEVAITEFFNITEDEKSILLSSTDILYNYLEENIIGEIEYKDDTIKIENPYSTNTILVQTSNIEEIENETEATSIVELASDIYCVYYENSTDTKEGYETLNENDKIDAVYTDVKVTTLDDETSEITVTASSEEEASALSVNSSMVVWGRSTTGMNLYSSELNYLNKLNQESEEVTVAVLDTGVRTTHEVFASEETADRLDTTLSYNYIGDSYDITDDNGHGTMTAGIIAECTSDNVKIVPVKVMDEDGSGGLYKILTAVTALAGKVDIINLSLGLSKDTMAQISDKEKSTWEEVFEGAYDSGTMVICASGNEGDEVTYPASSEYTIAVGALNTSGTIASFSNYGDSLDFTAPGQGLILPYYTGDDLYNASFDSSTTAYQTNSGTSFASPFVAAAAALIKTENNDYTIEQITEVLKENSEDLGDSGKDVYYGYGSINFGINMFASPVIASITTSSEEYSAEIYALCTNKLVSYYCSTSSTEPKDSDWITFTNSSGSTVSANIITLTLNASSTGTYYIWIKDKNGNTTCKEFTISGEEENNEEGTAMGNVEVEQLLDDGYYEIYSALSSNMILEISGSSLNDGGNAQIWSKTNAKCQKFKVAYLGDGYYQITNCVSNKVLDVAGAGTSNGTNVQQYTYNGSAAQKWILEDCGDGYFYIKSACNELYLDIAAGSTNNGTNVQVYSGNGTNAQKFKFVSTDTIMGEQTIDDGYYQITSAINTNYALDVAGASINNGANVQLSTISNIKQEKFKIEYIGDGYYKITNANSSKVLDVSGGSATNGTNVQQYSWNGSLAQRWIIYDLGDGRYSIMSALEDYYLDVSCGVAENGSNLQIYEGNDSNSQKFLFTSTTAIMGEQTISDGYYQIASAVNSNYVLDVAGGSTDSGANIQLSTISNIKQEKFKIEYIGDGYYKITNANSSKVLDVAWGISANGTNVQQYDWNDTLAQKWMIVSAGDGTYNIVSALNDYYLDVSCGIATSGSNIQIYEGNGSSAQKFTFSSTTVVVGTNCVADGTYTIMTRLDTSKVIDISGGSTSNGGNAQIWSSTNVLQQKFEITYLGDGYYSIISCKSGKALDVAGGTGASGTNIQQYDWNGSLAQKWMFIPAGNGIYNIVSALNDLYIDVAAGSSNDGTNIQIYEGNGSTSQQFSLLTTTAIKLEEGTYGVSGLQIKGDSRGSSLKYYKIGNGPNVFFATFAVHGWEDKWSYDGQELTKIANAFKDYLIDLQDASLASKWTIYIFPSVNPDGEYYGSSHNGPGRTTLYSAAPTHQGIDINRCWSVGYSSNSSSRNYNGTAAFQAYEAVYLRDFLLNHRSTSGQTVLVDLHGWLNETLGDSTIGSYYRAQYGLGSHISSYGNGYLINWARSNLGYNGVTARACLVELPSVSSSSQVSSGAFSTKYINATLNMLRAL